MPKPSRDPIYVDRSKPAAAHGHRYGTSAGLARRSERPDRRPDQARPGDGRQERSGITSDTELLEYALAKVAIEDDFGAKLVRRKGRIAKDIDLEL
jgi:hypothetical protein